MAKAQGSKPLIAGGRTLSKMRSGGHQDGGGKRHSRRRSWFQAGNMKGSDRGSVGSWPVGELPEVLQPKLVKV